MQVFQNCEDGTFLCEEPPPSGRIVDLLDLRTEMSRPNGHEKPSRACAQVWGPGEDDQATTRPVLGAASEVTPRQSGIEPGQISQRRSALAAAESEREREMHANGLASRGRPRFVDLLGFR